MDDDAAVVDDDVSVAPVVDIVGTFGCLGDCGS